MTPQVKDFLTKHKDKIQGTTLEVGALDVNGSVQDIVPITVAVDMRKGKGVNLVCDVIALPGIFGKSHFDACVSCETLEHVEDWKGFVQVTWDMVKEGGYLVMTMASMLKKRHAYPDDYWRFTLEQIQQIYPNADVCELGKTSIGWVVKKQGTYNLDVEPYKVP